MGDRLSGDSQSFTCLTEGSDPQISFYHNGVRLEEGVSGDTLTIPSTTPAKTGMYHCSVENESGSDSFSWYLIVRDPSECSYCSRNSSLLINAAVEPLNNGHISDDEHFVHCSEVVPSSEVEM